MRSGRVAGAAFALAVILHSLLAATIGPAVEEYPLKAAFILNIAKFVEWPVDVFQGPKDPIVLCVLGANPFGDALEQATRGRTADDRSFAIRHVSEVRQAAGCHILFVSVSEHKRLHTVLDEIPSSGILTVGDTDDFTKEGGVVNLRLEGDKIRIRVNVQAATREKIRISAKLLSLAQIVNP
ncbi:MAG TPA: YfiR family protein [Bryobacteraceae bacterium]|nr:YfiR family protein [Bryobacteraceae bacterium]